MFAASADAASADTACPTIALRVNLSENRGFPVDFPNQFIECEAGDQVPGGPRPTCAPHVARQRGAAPGAATTARGHDCGGGVLIFVF